MTTSKEILIAGAGSAGLSAALFLAESGFKPRVIEKRIAPSAITKALGVNPNTLQLFEQTEITQKFLQNGWKCSCMNMWSKRKLIYKNDFSRVKHPYPFMLIQPQFETERIIEEALASRGVAVERGLSVERIEALPQSSKLVLKDKNDQLISTEVNGVVIGADGHKSKVRESLGISFDGWEHHEPFTFFDIELDTPITHKEGHYFLFREGAMLMLHIRDGVWRVGGNIPDVLDYLPKGTRTGKVHWETNFTIREKVAASFHQNQVYLLGDAAHIHSPVGAKGMNLCIEDGYIFASLFKQNRESEFHRLRHAAMKRNVGILGQVTDKVGGQNMFSNALRDHIGLFRFMFPMVMPAMKKFLLGLR